MDNQVNSNPGAVILDDIGRFNKRWFIFGWINLILSAVLVIISLVVYLLVKFKIGVFGASGESGLGLVIFVGGPLMLLGTLSGILGLVYLIISIIKYRQLDRENKILFFITVILLVADRLVSLIK